MTKTGRAISSIVSLNSSAREVPPPISYFDVVIGMLMHSRGHVQQISILSC